MQRSGACKCARRLRLVLLAARLFVPPTASSARGALADTCPCALWLSFCSWSARAAWPLSMPRRRCRTGPSCGCTSCWTRPRQGLRYKRTIEVQVRVYRSTQRWPVAARCRAGSSPPAPRRRPPSSQVAIPAVDASGRATLALDFGRFIVESGGRGLGKRSFEFVPGEESRTWRRRSSLLRRRSRGVEERGNFHSLAAPADFQAQQDKASLAWVLFAEMKNVLAGIAAAGADG